MQAPTMPRCGLTKDNVPRGSGCKFPGTMNEGCMYELAWESLALAAAGTDATLKHVPRSGQQLILDFLVSTLAPVASATGPGQGRNYAAFLTALTVNSRSFMPVHNSGSGAAFSSNKYPLAAFRRDVMQRGGGVMASLRYGNGTPWAQFGVHMIVLGTEDDVTLTVENNGGLTVELMGTLVILQLNQDEKRASGAPLDQGNNAKLVSKPATSGSGYQPVP